MLQPVPQKFNTIFERKSQNKGVVDFKKATPQLKFDICQLTIESILKILQNNLARDIPENTFKDFAISLRQISNGLYQLQMSPLGTMYPFKQIREYIDKAEIKVSAALDIFDDVYGADNRYEHIRNCKLMLENAVDIIKGFPFPSS
jgi:hypothetical protein